jgi:hypothetical protein
MTKSCGWITGFHQMVNRKQETGNQVKNTYVYTNTQPNPGLSQFFNELWQAPSILLLWRIMGANLKISFYVAAQISCQINWNYRPKSNSRLHLKLVFKVYPTSNTDLMSNYLKLLKT